MRIDVMVPSLTRVGDDDVGSIVLADVEGSNVAVDDVIVVGCWENVSTAGSRKLKMTQTIR